MRETSEPVFETVRRWFVMVFLFLPRSGSLRLIYEVLRGSLNLLGVDKDRTGWQTSSEHGRKTSYLTAAMGVYTEDVGSSTLSPPTSNINNLR